MKSKKRGGGEGEAAQLSLFAGGEREGDGATATATATASATATATGVDDEATPVADREALAEIAARLPAGVKFGTSSWSFPGWRGLVYSDQRSESQLARDGLVEYARHPLLQTVGIDRGYYAPIPERDLARYATQLPPGFRCCTKAPEMITAPIRLAHRGARAGEANPDFLSAERFRQVMVDPFDRAFREHAGPFILEFPPVPKEHRLDPEAFAEKLDGFLGALPTHFEYAVELRDRRLLTRSYASVLKRRGAGHVYNYWTAMPMPATQLATVPIDNGPFVIVRLLLRPGTKYNERKADFTPFDKLAAPDPGMRQDVLSLILSATGKNLPIWILVNNKAEGCAPLTIRALAEMLVDR